MAYTVATPKRLSRDAQPAGRNQAAYQMVRRATQTDPEPNPPKVSRSEIARVMAAMGQDRGQATYGNHDRSPAPGSGF